MLYLYALADRRASVNGCSGADGEPLRALMVDALSVIVGERSSAPAVDRASLETQDRVVRELHRRAEALLPMRFGVTYPDEAAITRAIELQATSLTARLERVRGKEQMTLRVLRGISGASRASGASSASGGSGLRYLESRRMPEEIRPLLAGLQEFQRGSIVERGRTAELIATVYHLIDRGTSDAYRRRAEHAATAHPELRVHISGPAPCYAFA
jgi:hypothetical protein